MTNHNRDRKLPGQDLSAADVRALLRACNRGPTGARNRALIVLLWRAGLRTQEALDLRESDLDPPAGLVYVRRGKGGRPRTVGLDPESFGVVEAWIERRRALGLDRRSTLLCTLVGRPLDPGYCRAMVQRLARRAGLRSRVHLHGLRHSYATQALREGVPLNVLQAQLGHRRLATTAVYLSRVSPDDLAAAARGRPSWSSDPHPVQTSMRERQDLRLSDVRIVKKAPRPAPRAPKPPRSRRPGDRNPKRGGG